MRSLTAQQKSILASDNIELSWLFDVKGSLATNYWSTKTKTYGGHNYSYKIDPDSLTELSLTRAKDELAICGPSELRFEVENSGSSLSASNYSNGTVLVKFVAKDLDAGTEDTIRSWRFNVKVCYEDMQSLIFECEDFLQESLRGEYPNTRLIKDIFPSDDPDTGTNDNLAIPVSVGTCYIPIRSVGATKGANYDRYYLLGRGASYGSYTIHKVRSPREWGARSTWASASYDFTMATISDRDSTQWTAFQAIIADSDNDGTADANGLWLQGDRFLDMPTKFYFRPTFAKTNPAEWMSYVLQDMGISSSLIDSSSFSIASHTFNTWGLTWNGAHFYKRPREEVISELLTQCHSTFMMTDSLELNVLSKASVATITSSDILMNSDTITDDTRSTFANSPADVEEFDAGYAAYQESDEPQDQFIKIIVPVKNTKNNISSDVVEIPFVQNAQHVQKLACLYYQRKYLPESEKTFSTCIQKVYLDPGDIIAIEGTDYGGTYKVMIDEMSITHDGEVRFSVTKFSQDLDDWGDLTFSDITILADNSTVYWSPVTSGPDATVSGGGVPNQVNGRFVVGDANNYILFDPNYNQYPGPLMKFMEGGLTNRLQIGILATNDYGIKARDSSGNVVFFINSTEAKIAGWNFDTNKIYNSNIEIDNANSRIQSTNFQSGILGRGFRLEPNLLEVGNIYARGKIKTTVFEKDSVSAVGGDILIRPSDILNASMSCLDSASMTLASATWASGSVVRIKAGTEDEWLKIDKVVNKPIYHVVRDEAGSYATDSNPNWKKGASVVNYGLPKEGGILLTSSSSNGPNISMFTIGTDPWVDGKIYHKLRFGNLTGFLGYGSSATFGIAIGDTNRYFKYDKFNGLRIKGSITVNGEISAGKLYSSNWATDTGTKINLNSEWIKFGGNRVAPSKPFSGIFLGKDSGSYKFFLGSNATNEGSFLYDPSAGLKFKSNGVTVFDIDTSGNASLGSLSLRGNLDMSVGKGDIILGSGGSNNVYVRQGKTYFGEDAEGFILGIEDGWKTVFDVGDSSNYIRFDSTSGSVSIKTTGGITLGTGGSLTIESGGAMTVQSGGDVTVDSGGKITVNADQGVYVGASGSIYLVGDVGGGGKIDLGGAGSLYYDTDTSTVWISGGSSGTLYIRQASGVDYSDITINGASLSLYSKYGANSARVDLDPASGTLYLGATTNIEISADVSYIFPQLTDTTDLGTSSLKFKNLYLSQDVYLDAGKWIGLSATECLEFTSTSLFTVKGVDMQLNGKAAVGGAIAALEDFRVYANTSYPLVVRTIGGTNLLVVNSSGQGNFYGNVKAGGDGAGIFYCQNTAGVSWGPGAPSSITVKGGIVTAVS